MKLDKELAVGFFLMIGIFALAYLSVNLGRLEMMGGRSYSLYGEFENVGGIKNGAVIEIGGVEIGKVKSVRLYDYQALVEFSIDNSVKIQQDAIASIKTKGLIGEKYVQITPGASEKILSNGDRIRETESAIDVEELISKYVFGKV